MQTLMEKQPLSVFWSPHPIMLQTTVAALPCAELWHSFRCLFPRNQHKPGAGRWLTADEGSSQVNASQHAACTQRVGVDAPADPAVQVSRQHRQAGSTGRPLWMSGQAVQGHVNPGQEQGGRHLIRCMSTPVSGLQHRCLNTCPLQVTGNLQAGHARANHNHFEPCM
jgi:hypothetical protein